jgi:hypothetical protein
MPLLPAPDLRSNLATWAVPTCLVPAIVRVLLESLPQEVYDPGFRGQDLGTTYFDTPRLTLRRARRRGQRYLTLRLRCYATPGQPDAYALSAKTESQKFRVSLDAASAEALRHGGPIRNGLARWLPGELLARLLDLIDEQPLVPIVVVNARRYAVEDAVDRLSLDVDVGTDTGKQLPFAVLEHKSTEPGALPPGGLTSLDVRPIKLSKFLWATDAEK